MSKKPFGPAGTFPEGMLGPDDAGALQIGIAHDSTGNVIINFGTKVSWVGFSPSVAITFARQILKHAGVKSFTIEL